MAEGNLADREITGNAFLFLIAGHEKTAHNLMYTFYLLFMHPQVQEKMKEEVKFRRDFRKNWRKGQADRVYGDREPRYEDFKGQPREGPHSHAIPSLLSFVWRSCLQSMGPLDHRPRENINFIFHSLCDINSFRWWCVGREKSERILYSFQ